MSEHIDIPELNDEGLRRFAFVTAAIVSGLFGIGLPWLFGVGYPIWPWVFAGALAVGGLLAPARLRPIYRGWMRFGLLMNRVTTPIVLGLVFFAVFTPIAIAMRLARRDPMARTLDEEAGSYRVPSRRSRRESMERPY